MTFTYGLYFHSLSQLAGVVAVEITGGPTIEFNPGRKVNSLALHLALLDK